MTQLNNYKYTLELRNKGDVSFITLDNKAIVWLPSDKVEFWLNTTASTKYIEKKIAEYEEALYAEVVQPVKTPPVTEYIKTGYHTLFNTNTEEVVVVSNVAQFCRERNINYSTFKKLVQGRRKTSQGWVKVL